MTGHIPHLRVVRSTGRREPMELTVDGDLAPVEVPRPSIPCGGCQHLTRDGDLIVKYRRSWWHERCADRDVEQGNASAAWIALGHDLARSPRSYRVGEARAIVGALLGMVHDPDGVEVVDDERAG